MRFIKGLIRNAASYYFGGKKMENKSGNMNDLILIKIEALIESSSNLNK